jgi:bifunctional DNase/RNase
MMSMVAVQIVGLQLDAESRAAVVLLAESDTPTRVLPILIGPAESQSIAIAATGLTPPRPGTHDLMITMLEKMDSRLQEVAVTELVGGVFFAELFVETPTGLHRISSRPSDGIALAMRVGAPIVVAAAVLDAAAVGVRHEPSEPFSDDEIDAIVADFHETLDSLEPSDFDTGPESAT